MSTQDEREVGVRATPMKTFMRLRRWAARRTRQGLQILVAQAIGVVLVVAGAFIWRSASLFGLPDIGDSFDVAASYRRYVPGDQDAFVTFRRAPARLSREPDLPRTVRRAGPGVGWSKADPKVRQ
jgi:hypothetical protein